MALHTDTEIYRATYDLCKLATEYVANMERKYKADFGAELRKRCMALVMRTYEANTSEDKPPILRRMRQEAKVRSQTHNWSRKGYYLKVDLANFFVSIDKRILWPLLMQQIPERWWRGLTKTVLFHDPREDYELRGSPDTLAAVPEHKRLTNAGRYHGLPIGNLSSQFFANILLNELDQHIKHRIRARHYTRYVDDMVLLHESPDWLNAARADIDAFLPSLGLALNPRKTVLQPIDRGIDYVGQVILPWRRVTRRRTLSQALTRLEDMPDEDVYASGNSYLGLVRQASHSHHEQALLCRALLKRGHAVDGLHLEKAFRKRGTATKPPSTARTQRAFFRPGETMDNMHPAMVEAQRLATQAREAELVAADLHYINNREAIEAVRHDRALMDQQRCFAAQGML